MIADVTPKDTGGPWSAAAMTSSNGPDLAAKLHNSSVGADLRVEDHHARPQITDTPALEELRNEIVRAPHTRFHAATRISVSGRAPSLAAERAHQADDRFRLGAPADQSFAEITIDIDTIAVERS